MVKARVVVVHLRRPHLSNPEEMRSDPFWEFGSFGLTGCHSKNLMNPKKSSELNGVRFAFAQGGELGMRLVYLSPPVKIARHGGLCEATWQPHEMPFKYSAAPVLIDHAGQTGFPLLKRFLKLTDRGDPFYQPGFEEKFNMLRHNILTMEEEAEAERPD